MKVTYVSTLARGGPIAHLEGLVPYVAAAGADVDVIVATRALAARFESLGVPAHVIPVGDKRDLVGAARLWPRMGNVDVVHSQDRRAGLFARTLGRARGARVVHTLHGLPEDIAPAVGRDGGSWIRPGVSRRRRWWLESVYLRAEAALATLGLVVTPSRAMKRYLVEGGMPSHRIAVVPSCVPVRRRAPRPLGVPATIGTVANLEWWKGVDMLILALSRVKEPARLEIFGDGAERPALQKLASSCGVDATFHGHTGDAAARLGSLDVFVLPSRAENFPIALLEAMSWALPSVATRVGGIPEMVEPGETGLLVPPDDVDALAAAVVSLIRHPEWSRRLGAAAASRVAERHDPEDGGRAMMGVYRELCASSM
ncbi:MAG TPA: glycosyltransferase family 4 protein [Actinomycetota bacterium]|nr:glycosyltransferase family 4 protein [Actinomycetota bacterium]